MFLYAEYEIIQFLLNTPVILYCGKSPESSYYDIKHAAALCNSSLDTF